MLYKEENQMDLLEDCLDQVEKGFSASDMATAKAQGFRDGYDHLCKTFLKSVIDTQEKD